MNVAIASFGEKGKKLYELLKADNKKKYNVVCIFDADCNLWGNACSDEDVKVVSSGKAVKMYQSGAFDKFIIPSLSETVVNDILSTLHNYEIPSEACLYSPIEVFCDKNLCDEERILKICSFETHTELDAMEIHVTDHCNLSCKHCTMFAGLVPKDSYDDFDATINGLHKLKEFFSHVKKFRVLGGEPLLNSRLDEYLDDIRCTYPYAEIQLISNGLLVKSMPNKLINSIQKNNVVLYISYYNILADAADDIDFFLKQHNINHVFTKPITTFQKVYDAFGNSDYKAAFYSCTWRRDGCETLKNGTIAPCFVPFVIHYLSDKFDLGIEPSGTIDLFEPGLTTAEIRRRLRIPFKLCKYCSQSHQNADWEMCDSQSANKISDWSI